MIALASGVRVYLACGVTDMRKGMTGLAMLVQQGLAADPFDGAVFAFRGRRAQRVSLCIFLLEAGQPDGFIVLIILIEFWPTTDDTLHAYLHRFGGQGRGGHEPLRAWHYLRRRQNAFLGKALC